MNISDLNIDELTDYMLSIGEKKFRARQIYKWLHVSLVTDFSEMTDLSKELRKRLSDECMITVLKPVEIQTSAEDGTKKYLFELSDGNLVESVLMRYRFGCSVCISSQVGCRMGCRFCASTIDGWLRNLTPGEMLGQVEAIQRNCKERVSHVVVMGTGEPLDNYDNLLAFIRMLTDPNGLNISQRDLTVSTCGLVDKIRQLAEEKLSITLALSLHASDQEKRMELMPIARRFDINETVAAMKYYQRTTGRRVTFEYSLISGVNDRPEDARKLSVLLSGIGAHINLIPVNPIKERDFVSPSRQAAEAFADRLAKYGINVTIRREMGRDIDGACGQLRRRRLDEKGNLE
ncbi:23S rRNA (adenine(2503)-C(2))-methyltransferase RlmN [Candidatus Weimeria sp. HCP3S3_B5]|uniref:23S rRNA (adenine(2503)-C(2))-methyltransferase RlmN n=1 Tax=Candidatus Weimeria sp. HCP3S3_B5 TaxID=3438871 RepID=UPI003F8B4A0E